MRMSPDVLERPGIEEFKRSPEDHLIQNQRMATSSGADTPGLRISNALCYLMNTRFKDAEGELRSEAARNPDNVVAARLLEKTVHARTYFERVREENRILNLIEFQRQETVLKSLPVTYILGLTNACNLRCPLCVTGSRQNAKPTRFMDLDLFREVIEKIKEYAYTVQLYKWGESLLHQNFIEILKYCNRYDLNTEVSSNLSLRNIEDKLEAMVKYRLKHLIVSFDGVNPDDYQRYRVGGDFPLVCDNIRKLHDLKRHSRSIYPKISLQFLRNRFTGNQLEVLHREHKALGADAYYVCDMTMPFKDHDIDKARQWFTEGDIRRRKYLDIDVSMHGKVCYFLYTTMIIEQDGSIPPCCFSTQPTDDYGKWEHHKSITEMYNSERFVSARKAFKQRFSAAASTCSDCTVLRTYLDQNTVPFVSVIVPTYNRAGMIGKTISSLLGQNYPKDRYEVIVVDNNSSDDTRNVVAALQSGSAVPVRYLVEKRQGVHYARNTAGRHAAGEILYFTDDDMLAAQDALRELIRIFVDDSRVASATGRVLPQWEVKPPDWVLKLCCNLWLSINDQGESFFVSDTDPGVFSCHMAIRRGVFLTCGGFNPENTAGEWIGDGETGLNAKIKSLGHKFAYNGRSVVYHMIPASRMTQEYLNRRLANQGNCDSYSAYREHRFTEAQLRAGIVRHMSKLTAHVQSSVRRLLENDDRWRMDKAYAQYYQSRMEYDFRLMQDAAWRELVLRDNWIEMDSGEAAAEISPVRSSIRSRGECVPDKAL